MGHLANAEALQQWSLLVMMLQFCNFICCIYKIQNILRTFLLTKKKTTKIKKKKKKENGKSLLSPLTSLHAILKEIALDQLAIENPRGMGQLMYMLPKRKQNCHVFCLRCGRKNQIKQHFTSVRNNLNLKQGMYYSSNSKHGMVNFS